MALNFPPSPNIGDIYAGGVNSSTWVWNGQAWVIYARDYGIDWSGFSNGATLRHVTTNETLRSGGQAVCWDLWIWNSLTVAGSDANYNWGTSVVGNEALLNIKTDLNIDGSFTVYGTTTFDVPQEHPTHNANYWQFTGSPVTTVSLANTWYLLNTSTTSGPVYGDLSVTNNRITNDGTLKRFKVEVALSMSAGNNEALHGAVYKSGVIIPESEMDTRTFSGGKASPMTLSLVTDLDTGEYLEVWVKNQTAAQDITLSHINVAIDEITR